MPRRLCPWLARWPSFYCLRIGGRVLGLRYAGVAGNTRRAKRHVAGLIVGVPQLVGPVCSIGLIGALSLLLKHTRFGRALRTIAEDFDTALMLGININRLVALVLSYPDCLRHFPEFCSRSATGKLIRLWARRSASR